MTDFLILRDLGWVLVSAATVLFATRPLRVPPILAYMVAGLLLGSAAGIYVASNSVELISELGVALLLFVVGMELSLDKLRDVGRPAVVAGTLQVVLTLLLGAGLAIGLGFPWSHSVFIALALTFSSTVVVVKLLDRAGDLESLHGRLSIGILLVQDVLVAVVLTLIGGLGGAGDTTEVGAVVSALAVSFLGIVGLSLLAAAAVRWVLPAVLDWLMGSGEAVFVVGLTWVLAFILAAEAVHVSIELGAFIAGVALAQLHESEELRRRVHPLVDLFIAVFFVSLGAGIDATAAARMLGPALLLSVFVLAFKPVLLTLLVARFGHSTRTAVLTGITLGQISEFGFIVIAAAVGAGLVPASVLALIGVVGIVTIGVSSVLVPQGPRVHALLERRGLLRLPGHGPPDPAPPPARRGHVVVVGMNTLGRHLVRRFDEAGQRVLAVDTDQAKLRGLEVETLHGDVDDTRVLDEAGVSRAKLVVSALQIEDVNSLLAYRCGRMGVPVSIHAFDASLAHELLELGADHVMASKLDGIRPMKRALRAMQEAG